MISKTSFGKTSKGEEAFLYTLTSEKGMTVKVTNYGATLCALQVLDKNANIKDVVQGYDNVTGYDKETGTFFGATVGENINRNEKGFSHSLWEEKTLHDTGVTFRLHSLNEDPEGVSAIDIELTYILNDNKLCIIHRAKASSNFFLNMTNHSCFNLNGHQSGNILDHLIWINADKYLEMDQELTLTGRILDVENTPMDFRRYKKIGRDIGNHWVLKNNNNFEKVAKLYSEKSGITMEVYTDMKGVQVYTGNFIQNEKGKEGICFETQYFPNEINDTEFEIAKLNTQKRFCSVTVYKFIV